MLNAEIIRISSLSNIVLPGHIIRLSTESKNTQGWPEIVDSFLEKLKQTIQGEKNQQNIKVIQRNETSKLNVQIPHCSEFSNLSQTMSFCHDFCSQVKEQRQIPISFLVTRTNLEQTFLAYATHQKQFDHNQKK